jgi:hypothetical protein
MTLAEYQYAPGGAALDQSICSRADTAVQILGAPSMAVLLCSYS